jgi:hypothetical protein
MRFIRSTCFLSTALLALAAGPAAASSFALYFDNATLRVDYFRSGDAGHEVVTLDRLYRQGPWAGPRAQLVDEFPHGGSMVELRDTATGEILYSQRYDSLFGEYRTTGPAADGIARTYHETVLLPFPKRPVLLRLSSRQSDGTLQPLFEIEIDPAATPFSLEPPAGGALVVEAHVGAAPPRALDIAILGEGYTEAEAATFRTDLERAASALLGFEPFASHRDRLSIRGVLLPSEESGCDEPSRGSFRDTTLDASFDALGSERYLLTEDNRRLRDVAANVPYDALVIMVNHDRYGGGGIYRLYCTFTTHSPWAEYLLLHEFGHSFAGLADEYYSSQVAYNEFYPRGREPDEPNITALLDPEQLKWKDLVAPGTPLPTPWPKEAFDAADGAYQAERTRLNEAVAEAARAARPEAEVQVLRQLEERHAEAHARWVHEFLSASESAGLVGAFEGAGYSSQGLYRPQLDCLMFSRRAQPYCAVCKRAVEAMIRRYSD